MTLLKQEIANGIALLTLNRPEAMNALSRALRSDLADAIEAVDADPEVKVIIFSGEGRRAFSAGLDLKEVGQFGLGGAPDGKPARRPSDALVACSKPSIAAVNGVALTGGFELALACDILIASSSARFADTHVRVGVTPGSGMSQRLSRIIGISRAKEMSLTGNFIDANTAFAWGLVNHVVEPDELMPLARRIAADVASCDSTKVTAYKALIDEGYALPFGESMAVERRRATSDNRKVSAESVEAQRVAVIARGRDQA